MSNKKIHKLYPYIICAMLFVLSLTMTSSADTKAEKISRIIKEKYESILFTLEPEIQKHFAVRMYRLTGNEKYIYPIIYDFLISLNKLERYSKNILDTIYIHNQARLLLDKFNIKTRKGKKRRELFKDKGPTLFYLDLLYNTNKLAEYHLAGSNGNLFGANLAQLEKFDFKSFLLDSATIKDYAPQAVNYIYYLNGLRIVDIRTKYKSAFQNIYPDSLDSGLSETEFMDKIYGLTHFITVASGYYQHPVDSLEFSWILNYFDKNINRIIQDTKPDVMAEVGICFLLCNRRKNKALEMCRKAIIKAYNKKYHMILSTRNGTDLAKGEHRNILAIMLLDWPDSLYPGPYLNNFSKFNELIGR